MFVHINNRNFFFCKSGEGSLRGIDLHGGREGGGTKAKAENRSPLLKMSHSLYMLYIKYNKD